MFLFQLRRPLVCLASVVAVLCSCADETPHPTASRSETPDTGLPKLKPGGSLLIVVPGGSVPEAPAGWTAGFGSALRATPAANERIGTSFSVVAAARTPAPHFEHVLLQNSATGAVALWVVSRGSIVNSAGLGTMPAAWLITGAGDFDRNGFEDILWENTADGSRAVWLMDGSGGVRAAISFGVVPLEWHMAGAGDYNSDGNDDILWENTSDGSRVLWIMNGGSVLYTVAMGTLSTDWRMTGANDYNSDGKDDILLDNDDTGLKAVWLMNGNGAVASSVILGTLPSEWRMIGGGDIDGDYHEDLLFENTSTGNRTVWLENGFAKVTSAPLLTQLSTEWQMKTVLKPDLGDRSGTWIGLGSAGHNYTNCGLRTGGVAYCWGDNTTYGNLGLNHADPVRSSYPLPVSTRVRFSDIASGQHVACGIDLDGAAHCWGNLWNRGASGSPTWSMLGNGALGGSTAPTPVTMPAGVRFSRISTYADHTCALSTAGQIYCWGYNESGQLGTGDLVVRSVPTPVSGEHGTGAMLNYSSVVVGASNTCAVASGGVPYCWGRGGNGGPRSPRPALVYLPESVVDIAAGNAHHCAVGLSGSAYCWGSNGWGEVGIAAPAQPTTPRTIAPPAGVTFAQVSAGTGITCALTTSGGAYCWGNNGTGAYGNGTNTGSGHTPRAVSVPQGVRFIRLIAGGTLSVCALADNSRIYCWGEDDRSQAGSGEAYTGGPVLTPSLVVEPRVIVAQ